MKKFDEDQLQNYKIHVDYISNNLTHSESVPGFSLLPSGHSHWGLKPRYTCVGVYERNTLPPLSLIRIGAVLHIPVMTNAGLVSQTGICDHFIKQHIFTMRQWHDWVPHHNIECSLLGCMALWLHALCTKLTKSAHSIVLISDSRRKGRTLTICVYAISYSANAIYILSCKWMFEKKIITSLPFSATLLGEQV